MGDQRSRTDIFHDTYQMIGGYVPIEKVSHLSLYCAVYDTTKNKIITEMFHSFVDSIEPVDKLLNQLGDDCHDAWQRFVAEESYSNQPTGNLVKSVNKKWAAFKEKLTSDLKKKKLTNEYINYIIRHIEEKDAREK